MNLQLTSLLTTVKTRLYDNLPQYWINQYKQNKLIQRVFGIAALITLPITYFCLIEHWSLLLFLLLTLISAGSVAACIISFLNIHKKIPYKKLLKNSLSKEQLYDFCEQEIVAHFSWDHVNIFPDFNIELTNEELQQLTQIKFNHEQLEYLYALLKDERNLELCHLFQLEIKEEKTVENYQEVFNKFVIKNELDNTFKIDLKSTKEEEKETYYEKYL